MGEQLPKIFDQGKKNATELKKVESRECSSASDPKNWPEAKLQILKMRKIAKRSFFGKEFFSGTLKTLIVIKI